MLHRVFVHESTGYNPQYFDNGQEVCFPIDFMYPNLIDQYPSNYNEYMFVWQVNEQKAFDLAGVALNFR